MDTLNYSFEVIEPNHDNGRHKRQAAPIVLLPPRPSRLYGRSSLLENLVSMLSAGESGWYAITGMAGIGKSALAYEALHTLAFRAQHSQHVFPAGIVALSATGRGGTTGLVTLLHDIIRIFSPSMSLPMTGDSLPDLAGAIDRTRCALAGKRVLLLLDDLNPQFPLRHAVQALLGGQHPSCIILATSRYIPQIALVTHHLHLGPLDVEAALELFSDLLGHPLNFEEHIGAERICTALGCLPLAIEAATTAAASTSIPLELLAEHIAHHPLDELLDSEGEIHVALAQTLGALDVEMQQRFVLLAALGTKSFDLACSTIINIEEKGQSVRALPSSHNDASMLVGKVYQRIEPHCEQLARTAMRMGQFVRHSLLEYSPASLSVESTTITHEARYQLHPLIYAYAWQCLQQLEPSIVLKVQRQALAYALTYIKCYHRDVPHLELEREFLLSALTEAWRREQFVQVVHLITGLTYLAGRLDTLAEGECILLWGIHASQRTHDRYHQSLFLNRLGGLLWARCEFTHAERVWQESLEIAQALGQPANLWEPLSSFVYIADVLYRYDAVQNFAERILPQTDDRGIVAAIRFIRGFYARTLGDSNRAFDDFNTCLALLSTQDSDTLSYERFFILEVQSEFARLQGDYMHAQEYTEAAVALANILCDTYTAAVLLVDQANFAYHLGEFDDTRALALRIIDLTKRTGASHYYNWGMYFLQKIPPQETKQLPELHKASIISTSTSQPASMPNTVRAFDKHEMKEFPYILIEELTERELDVLRLVAAGLSNREIAAQLVITVGTVKKHIEHIYGKLDAHNRTRAVAQARQLGLLH